MDTTPTYHSPQESAQVVPLPSTEVVSESDAKSKNRSDRFKAIVAVLIAALTVIGAMVAWRSSLAGIEAGNFDDAGLLAALNTQETSTISNLVSNQHRAAHVDYARYRQLAMLMVDELPDDPGAESDAAIREILELLDLSNTSKGTFFPAQYLDEDENYDAAREQAQLIAEAAQSKDLDADKHFTAANEWREKSVALVAVLIVLGFALFLFALAETIRHGAKYVLVLGGLGYMLVGSAAAIAIEIGMPRPDVYFTSLLISIVVCVVVLLGSLAAILLGFSRRGVRGVTHYTGEDNPREERFKNKVTVYIASVALLAATVAYLQADASAKGDSAVRRAQRFAADAVGAQATGESNVNYQYGKAYQVWKELDVLATAANEVGDEPAALRYIAVRDDISGLTDLLRSPYFDSETGGSPSLDAYQADTYLVKSTILSERSSLESALGNVWGEKGNNYIVHLTLLATALALLGLSMTLAGKVRPLFVGVASLIVVSTLVSVGLVFSSPVRETPLEAIEDYGRGVGMTKIGDYEGAIQAYEKAVEKAPHYSNAYYAKGDAQYVNGNYEQAVSSYRQTQTTGKDDANVAWNLGWTYYMLGDFAEAIRVDQHALELNTNLAPVRFNLGLAYLAAGKQSDAEREYSQAMDEYSRQVREARSANKEVPLSLWYYLDAAALDLDSLLDRLNDQERPTTLAPPKEKIANPDTVGDDVYDLIIRIKSLAVALEYTGMPPTGTPLAEISTFAFGVDDPDDSTQISLADEFQFDTRQVIMLYDYEGMADGQKVVFRVYLDDDELPEYRLAADWIGGEQGEQQQTVFTDDFEYSTAYTLADGEYTVEMYVDNHLVQRGGFFISEPEE